MGANFFSNQQNSLYHRINDDCHNFDNVAKTRKGRRTSEEEHGNLPLKDSLHIDNAQISMNKDRKVKRNEKLDAISDPVHFNSKPSSYLRKKREWNFYKKTKEDIFSKNKHYSKVCGKHTPGVDTILKDNKIHNEFENNPKRINTIKTRKKRNSVIYDSPDYDYDIEKDEDNLSKDEYELGLIPISDDLTPDTDLTQNSDIDLTDPAEATNPEDKNVGIITRNRKAVPLSVLFSKTFIQSLEKDDRECNGSDIIFPTKVGNTIVFRNRKITPIRSSDKFAYCNGTVISGVSLVKKSNYSVSQLTKIPVFLKTPKPAKISVAVKDSVLQNSSISSGAMSVSTNDTSRKNRTNGFFTKMISFMKSKVSDGEVPSDKCSSIKVDKEVYYDIGKDLPLIAKSQDFLFSNGTVINGGALLKKAKYSRSKLKEILLMEYENQQNNKGINKSIISTSAYPGLNGSVPLSNLELTTDLMNKRKNQSESEFINSVTISDRNLANTSKIIVSDNKDRSSTCAYLGLSGSYPIKSLKNASGSALSQKLTTDMLMMSSFNSNRFSTTGLPLSYSTRNLGNVSKDKILPVEPDAIKQKNSSKIDKHQPSFLKKLLPVQEAIKKKTSTEIHRIPRTTSLRTFLSELPTTDTSKAGFMQITPTSSIKDISVDRTTQQEQTHSDTSISQFAPIQQDRTMQDELLISTTNQFNPSSERTISNSIDDASMKDQFQTGENDILTSLSSLSSDAHEEIVTSSMASEGFSALSDDDKNLVTDDKVYTSFADSRIITTDQQESDVGSQTTPEDNSSTISLQIDTPLETESPSVLLSTEPLLEISPSTLNRETENNIILTSEIYDISTSKENLQTKPLDSDRSLSSGQGRLHIIENSTMAGELVKLVDKVIIEQMHSSADSSYLPSVVPESHTINANDNSLEQQNDMFPCLLDKLQNKDVYLINPDNSHLNDKFSAWHLHHTDLGVPCDLYFLEESNKDYPNLPKHNNRTVYRLENSGYDYYFCPSHPSQVFLIQRDHENKNFSQQNYLHFVDVKNYNLPFKHFHYLENADIFHDADLAIDDYNPYRSDTNFFLHPKVEKMTHVCHPYCHFHQITPSNQVKCIYPSNIESDHYYKLNYDDMDNIPLIGDQPSEIDFDQIDSSENNKLNRETKEDDYEPMGITFLAADETHNHLFPSSSENHNHPLDSLNEGPYDSVDDITCRLDHHGCHHHLNKHEGQVNELSCQNGHCSCHQHCNEKNVVEPLSSPNEERKGQCSFFEHRVCHGTIQPRYDLEPIQDYENKNHYKQVDNLNVLNSESPLGDQMVEKNIQNDLGGSIPNQDPIHQLENLNMDVESRQINPLNEIISQNDPLKDEYSSCLSDRQKGVCLISMELQNDGPTKDSDSKESDSLTLQNEETSVYSEKLYDDNLLQSEKSKEDDNSLQSEKSNQDDILLSERSNQDNFLLSEESNQDKSALEKLNEEKNLPFDEDNSVHDENTNESCILSDSSNESNYLNEKDESILHTEKLNECNSFLSDKSMEDNSLIAQKIISDENTFHSEVSKVGNFLIPEKVNESNIPLLKSLANNALDISNPLQDKLQQPEKLNINKCLLTNNTNERLGLYAEVDSTKNCSFVKVDSGVLQCPYCQRQYISDLTRSDNDQNHHLSSKNGEFDRVEHPCKNCGNVVPNWYPMQISYANNTNRIEKHAKDINGLYNENDLKCNDDETDKSRDLRINGNDLISGQSELVEERPKIKANEANVSSVFGMVCSKMGPKQKSASKDVSSSISLEMCSSLKELPLDMIECPFEHHINDIGVLHNNFQESIEKTQAQGANRDLGRPGCCGKTDLIENSITYTKNGEKDSNYYIKKIEPYYISSQSKSSFEKLNETVDSLVVHKNVDASPQNITNIKFKGKNLSLKQVVKIGETPPKDNAERWDTFVLNRNNGTLSHTPLKVPLVLSDDGKTVWTLHDYIIEADKNPLLSQKNAYYYIYDSFTPLGSRKSIKLLNGSTVLQGDLIKDANYSYSAFLGLLNVKADLQLNIDPEVTSKQCIDVVLVRQRIPNNKDGSVQGHSSDIFMADDDKKEKYYTDSKDMFWQDKILHESIFLPTNKTILSSRNKTNFPNCLNQVQKQGNPFLLKIVGLPDNNQLKDCTFMLLNASNKRLKNPSNCSPEERGIIEHPSQCNNQRFIPITVYNQECKGPILLKNKCPDDHSGPFAHKNKYDPIEIEDRMTKWTKSNS